MKDWIDLLATGDITSILVTLVLVLVTGGVGAAIVTTYGASRRGIRGDALIKEKNGIDGLSTLADKQGEYIDKLEERLQKLENDKEEVIERVTSLEKSLHDEVAYSNLLINILSDNTIPIPPRPIKE